MLCVLVELSRRRAGSTRGGYCEPASFVPQRREFMMNKAAQPRGVQQKQPQPQPIRELDAKELRQVAGGTMDEQLLKPK
jgi:hypothetical protein